MIQNILLFIMGIVLGSAGNAIIDRMPYKISWLKGRSKCDNCKHELSWKDLVPLLSYLSLQGRCRYCHKKIPVRNFLFELFMGVGFVALSTSPLLLPLFWVTMVIAVMDWETKLVSDLLVVGWFIAVLLTLNYQLFTTNLIGLGVGVLLIGGLWAATRGRGMGFGDVEIAGAMGLWLGWPKVGIGLWIAFVIGAIYGIYQIIKRKAGMRSEIAFGPFLILGAWIAYFWGDALKIF
jgi:leader peptidase (prepilin peptidase) / N-methyltransferase